VLDDHAGRVAAAPATAGRRELAEVTVLDRPLAPGGLADVRVILAIGSEPGWMATSSTASPTWNSCYRPAGTRIPANAAQVMCSPARCVRLPVAMKKTAHRPTPKPEPTPPMSSACSRIIRRMPQLEMPIALRAPKCLRFYRTNRYSV